MKKLLCLFSATLLVLSSCTSSSDDSFITDPAPVSMILPKSVIDFQPYSSYQKYSTSTISYDGNKIKSIKDGDNRTDYVYDGNNQIVKITEFENGVKDEERTYTYANGKLASSYYTLHDIPEYPTSGQFKFRSVYTYNSDGTIKKVVYDIDPTTGAETKSSYESLSTITNGNLAKVVVTDVKSGSVHTDVYEYDTKNNPYKNITGANLLVIDEEKFGSNNRLTASSLFSHVSGSSKYEDKIDYEYNTDGYPTKAIFYYDYNNDKNVNRITEYTY
jgi:hypothetical protein